MSSSQAQFIVEAANRYRGTDRDEFVDHVKNMSVQPDTDKKAELGLGPAEIVAMASFFVQVASFTYDLYQDRKDKTQIRKLVREEVGPVVERKGIPSEEFDLMVDACVDAIPDKTDEHVAS